MDHTAVLYYAAICACLAAVVPRGSAVPMRMLIGAVVGIAAASLLPILRSLGGV